MKRNISLVMLIQDMNIFDDMFQQITQTNAIRVNTYGEIGVVPCDFVNLQLKIGMSDSQFDNTENVKDKIDSYKEYQGYWKVFENTIFIDPKSCLFRQNLQLFRPTVLQSIVDMEQQTRINSVT